MRRVSRLFPLLLITPFLLILSPASDAMDPFVNANEDNFTQYGSLQGNYTDTFTADDVYQIVTEESTSGKPSNRVSRLEHRWGFQIPSNALTATFVVEARRDANSEGDNMRFEYTQSFLNWTPLLTVDGSTDAVYSASLPDGTANEIWIRVVDTDRSPGNNGIESVYVDNMFIEYTTAPMNPWPGGDAFTADDPLLRYTGRVDLRDPARPLFVWPGTRVDIGFTGTGIAVLMEDQGTNYFNAIIDGGTPQVFAALPGQNLFTIATDLAPGPHTLEINKRTERDGLPLVFLGGEIITGETLTSLPPRPTNRIEFYGDSITAGFSVDSDCDCGVASGKNHYNTYAAITARNLGHEAHCVAVSGIGLIGGLAGDTMPETYDNLDPNDPADNLWDFAGWVPDIVVVNLGQNDFASSVSAADYTQSYVDFQATLRGHYPNAEMFITLGNMSAVAPGSDYPDAVFDAVNQMRANGDCNTYPMIFPYNGHGGHPTALDHVDMADQLTAYINDTLNNPFPVSETDCGDGFDEDCDSTVDCDDPDCTAAPECQAGPTCGDGVCEPGEDCNSCGIDCPSKTKGKASNQYCCGNGVQEGPEGDGRCDGNF